MSRSVPAAGLHARLGALYARLSVPGAAATGHERWARIDALRAIAALMVLAAHAYYLGGLVTPPQSAAGYTLSNALACGVWLFFAVSGFLIAGPFLRALLRGEAPPPSRRYAARRAARILPAYWVALIAILALATGSLVDRWWQVPVHALLLHSLVPDESQRLFFVAWTLGVEAIFYALVPTTAVIVRRLAAGRALAVGALGRLVLCLWGAGVAAGFALSLTRPFSAHTIMPPAFTVLYLVLPLGNFCPGMLVFLAETPEAQAAGGPWALYRRLAGRPLPVAAAALALWVASQELHWQSDPLAFAAFHPLVGMASGLVLALVLRRGLPRAAVLVLAPIGLVSYGIYLWHWVVIAVMTKHAAYPVAGFSGARSVAHAAIVLVLTLPLALASWLLIERPLLRRTTLWDRRSPAPAAAAQASASTA